MGNQLVNQLATQQSQLDEFFTRHEQNLATLDTSLTNILNHNMRLAEENRILTEENRRLTEGTMFDEPRDRNQFAGSIQNPDSDQM